MLLEPVHDPSDEKLYLGALKGDPCSYCSAPNEQLDHIVARARGGADSWENLTASCGPCNNRKGSRLLLMFLRSPRASAKRTPRSRPPLKLTWTFWPRDRTPIIIRWHRSATGVRGATPRLSLERYPEFRRFDEQVAIALLRTLRSSSEGILAVVEPAAIAQVLTSSAPTEGRVRAVRESVARLCSVPIQIGEVGDHLWLDEPMFRARDELDRQPLLLAPNARLLRVFGRRVTVALADELPPPPALSHR
jgi:hypothetical protein